MSVLVDTSVWIDYLRAADTAARVKLRGKLNADQLDIVITEPISMELLAGPSSERGAAAIIRLIDGLPHLPVEATSDFRAAAAIFRACRRNGWTVRSLNDCLIAAIAIRSEVSLIHKDADFETIAGVTGLRQESWRSGAEA